MQNQVIQIYKSQLTRVSKTLRSLKKHDSRYAIARLLLAIVGVALAIIAFQHNIVSGLISIAATGVIFFLIFIRHEMVKDKIRFSQTLELINQNEINCLSGHKNIYSDGTIFMNSHHHNTADLDIFGPHSLFGLVNRCKTYYGNKFLSSYLSELSTAGEIEERRIAVKELTEDIEWRQHLHTILYNLETNPGDNFSAGLLNELDKDFSMFDSKAWYISLTAIPFIWVAILAMAIGSVPGADTLAFGFGGILFATYYFYIKRINEIQFSLSKGNELLSDFGEAFKMVYSKEWKSSCLRQITHTDKTKEKAIQSMFQLRKIMDRLDYRLNMIAGIFLNILLLWDFRIVRQLSIWKRSNFKNISQLFIVLGQVEAISSLSTWAFNNPSYRHAHIDKSGFNINAQEIIHPLMGKGQCVPNNFILGSDDYISIITGSNMSGKSTFLRTLGINMILAYSGTVSAAKSLAIPHAKVVTYMRIRDALEENVSTFRAELERVKMILNNIKNSEKCLFLIDEMLRGTNSHDKLRGSIAIVNKLLDSRAYAIIATHDIKLAEMGHDNTDHIQNYYFDIEFQGEELKFDYKIKEGICSNFNASFLLEKIGIK